jgi:uncharacterized protein (DUF433 family)
LDTGTISGIVDIRDRRPGELRYRVLSSVLEEKRMSSSPAPAKQYPHVAVLPDVSGGQPVVEGTRIPVATLVRAHQLGMDFDEILTQYPGLRPEGLHAAFVYYFDHQAEIDVLLNESGNPPPGAKHPRV